MARGTVNVGTPKVQTGAEFVVEQNNGDQLKFWVGTLEQFEAIETKNSGTTYIVTDETDDVGIIGDMLAAVYDPQGKKTDIFKYVDDQMEGAGGSTVFEATIGTEWTEDSETGVKSQFVALTNAAGDTPTGTELAQVDTVFTGDKTSDSYATFVEAQNQFLEFITNGYAETVEGGVTFYIFGDPNTVSIPIVVEVV